MPVPSRPFAYVQNFGPTTTSGVLVASGVGVLAGWSVEETTGTASAKLLIWDNASEAAGKNYGPITLNPGESARDWFGDLALLCASGGLYLQVLSGSVQGAVFYV